MVLWLLAQTALAAPEVGAIVRPEVAADIVPGDFDEEDPLTYATWVRAFASDETKRGDAWFIEGRLQHHAYFGEDVEGWWELQLGETGWNGRLGGDGSPVRLRAGALIERWGKLDLLPVLDVLNPRDARGGLLTPADHQRMAIPMATLQVGSDTVRSETTWIPVPSADRLWLRGTDWSPIRQGMLVDFYGEIRAWDGASGDVLTALDARRLSAQELDPSLRRGEDAATNLDSLPQALLYNGELAQRFEVYGRNFDLALVGGALRTRFPQGVLDPVAQEMLRTETLPAVSELVAFTDGGIPVDITWPRTWMGGVEGSGLIGPLQLRGETGVWSHRVVRQTYGRATTAPSLSAGLGVDYVRGSSLQVAVEARWQHLLEDPGDLVLAAADQIQIAAGLRTAFAAERLSLTLGGAYDVTFSELIARPSFAWRVSDAIQLEVGAILVEGFVTAPPDTLLEALNYEGGPASYWSQNDAVTFAVSWFL